MIKSPVMDYASQLSQVKTALQNAQNILVALPADPDMDQLAAGLALYLSLQQAGKNAGIVTSGTIKVGHTSLFGVGQIQNQLPQAEEGDLIITLAGVVSTDADGKPTVPALEKLDYYPQGADLNLVFRVLPGQKFEPAAITPHYQSSGFDLIFTVGAPVLTALGSIYNTRTEAFSGVQTVNIYNKQANTQFGTANVVDAEAASVSEMIAAVLPALQLPFEGDIATNVLTGIFAATSDLVNAGANTYEAVAKALRSGGQKPGASAAPTAGTLFQPAAAAQPQSQTQEQPVAEEPQSEANQSIAESEVETEPVPVTRQSTENFTVPTVVPEEQPQTPVKATQEEFVTASEDQPSPEEVPAGEEAITPELDWLIPKIYKGGSSKG